MTHWITGPRTDSNTGFVRFIFSKVSRVSITPSMYRPLSAFLPHSNSVGSHFRRRYGHTSLYIGGPEERTSRYFPAYVRQRNSCMAYTYNDIEELHSVTCNRQPLACLNSIITAANQLYAIKEDFRWVVWMVATFSYIRLNAAGNYKTRSRSWILYN